MISILDACADRNLFAPWFKDRASYEAWFAYLAALFALPMSAAQLAIYRECTGRTEPPTQPAQESYLCVGRRGGKSFLLALIGVYLSFRDYRRYLAPGERGMVMIIAADRRQARIILRYIRALLLEIPMLKRMITREGAEFFDLDNRISIEVATASFRTTRGYTCVAGLCDEVAFWPVDENAAESDVQILDALRPSMATIPNSMLLCASSPYAQKGALYEAYRRHFGKDGDPILIWQAPTRTMNPSVRQSIIDAAMERDPASASSEYLAQFRTDVASWVSRDALMACVSPGIHERAPDPRINFCAAVDPSGGSADSFALAICHRDSNDTIILDCIREIRAPFSPEAATKELAQVLELYGIDRVTGDRYGGEYPRACFAKFGIKYEVAEMTKSEFYLAALPLINSGRCQLLDDARMLGQFLALERRTARGGRDSVDHRPGAHDDVANACAAALVLAESARPPLYFSPTFLARLSRLPPNQKFARRPIN
jgi:hypothetical protein